MIIDKKTAIALLLGEESNKKYQDQLIFLNTLPKDAVLNVDIEETVMMHYLDIKTNEMYSFPVSFDYVTGDESKTHYGELKELNDKITESMKDEEFKLELFKKESNIGRYIFIGVCSLCVLSVILFIVYINCYSIIQNIN